MRWFILSAFLLLTGFTRIYDKHDDTQKLDDEFANVENTVQDRQFTIVKTTPAVNSLQDGEIVLFSSGAVKLMFREGENIYAVQVSCITF